MMDIELIKYYIEVLEQYITTSECYTDREIMHLNNRHYCFMLILDLVCLVTSLQFSQAIIRGKTSPLYVVVSIIIFCICFIYISCKQKQFKYLTEKRKKVLLQIVRLGDDHKTNTAYQAYVYVTLVDLLTQTDFKDRVFVLTNDGKSVYRGAKKLAKQYGHEKAT